MPAYSATLVRSVVVRELGPVEGLVIQEAPDPAPGPGQVVVAVEAAGVNFADALIVQGRYQMKPPVPFTPGGEIGGTVVAVGDGVESPAVGARVLAMVGLGGFASHVVIPAMNSVALPDNLDAPRAAGIIQSYCTMLFAYTRRTTIKEGEWVLVLGAGGGVGLAAVDIAKALGARVIAAASTKDKLDAAVALGAEATIAYEDEGIDLKQAARDASGGGVDVVVDVVGGAKAEPALRALGIGGRFIVLGFAAGEIPRIPINLVLLNNRTMVGVDWGSWAFRDFEGQRALLVELLDMVADGRLHPVAPTTVPLEDVAAALSDLEGRRVTGKLVLVP